MNLPLRPHPATRYAGTLAHTAYCSTGLAGFIAVVRNYVPAENNRREFSAIVYFAIKHFGIANFMLASRATATRNGITAWMRPFGPLTARDRERWPALQKVLLDLLAQQLQPPLNAQAPG